MTQNTLESALKMQEGRKLKNFPAQWKATPLPLDPHPLETLSHIFLLVKNIIMYLSSNKCQKILLKGLFSN